MKLDRIEIHNFRSIKDATIRFDQHCRVLLGKNEAGKSNVLKAIAALFGDYKVSSRDKRKKIDNEKIGSFYIRAVLRFSDEEIEKIVDQFEEDNIVIFEGDKSVLDFAKAAFREFLICLDIDDKETPRYSYWKFQDKNFKTTADGISLSLSDAIKQMFLCAQSLYNESPLVCHRWEYKDNYLLPSSVDIAAFVADPSICPGLKNIFVLCDRNDIKKEFDDAMLQDGDYFNLLEQVSTTVTSTFRNIWPDFKNTSIQLIPNGNVISVKVTNKAKYSFDDRSDGFKHFISILLMLSAPSKKGQIGERDIIIIDEPDTSLYPSSARYLRDELLRIGESSYVVYATHSQYMIDSDCINRHIIVEKKDDITTLIEPSEKAQFSDNELLLNAIGTSIFECVRNKNLIFEGWLDKKLFDKYISWNKTIKNSFKDFGRVYLHGITGAITLTQLLILAEKKFIIVADSDQTSTNKKKDFIDAYPDYKNDWIGYSDVIPGIMTVEDFLKPEYVEQFISTQIDSKFTFDSSKSVIKNIETLSKDKVVVQSIKNELIKGATKDDVKDEYGSYLNEIIKRFSD